MMNKQDLQFVVFDFGGGTCDVFVAPLKPRAAQAGVDPEAKSVEEKIGDCLVVYAGRRGAL
ncbi:MAG: hypothetical protein ACRD4E_17180 [Bryobacteraceae bacterium]